MQPKQRRSKGCMIGIGVAVSIVALLCIGAVLLSLVTKSSRSEPSPVLTTTQWDVTHTFTGNGDKKTENFVAGDTWKLQWSCGSGTSSENVIIDVHNADGSLLDPVAINTICNIGNTHGETIERQGGDIYLDVTSEGGWTVKVLEPQ